MYFWIFKKNIYLYKDFYFAWECLPVCVYAHYMYIVPTGAGVTAGCKPSDMVLGTELSLFSPNTYFV